MNVNRQGSPSTKRIDATIGGRACTATAGRHPPRCLTLGLLCLSTFLGAPRGSPCVRLSLLEG